MSSVDEILQERGKNYGDFGDIAAMQHMMMCAMCGKSMLNVSRDKYHALEMIALKMARIVCGDPNYVDNWDDIAGYATLISKRITASKSS